MNDTPSPSSPAITTVPYNTLVIAGGASKCIAAIGALFYLHEKGELQSIRNLAGTSAGAMLCYLFSIGYTPFEIIHFLCSSNFVEEFQNLNLVGIIEQRGLVNYYIVQEYLETLTLTKLGYIPTFRDVRLKLGKNLTIVTYNLTQNKVEYLSATTHPDMSCLTALRMTANVPILFDRFFYGGCEYIDGGLVDNFPINHCASPENRIVGINVSPPKSKNEGKLNYIPYLLKLIMAPCNFFNSQRVYPAQSTVIEIDTGVTSFEFNLPVPMRLNLFSKGYQAAKRVFEPSPPSSPNGPPTVCPSSPNGPPIVGSPGPSSPSSLPTDETNPPESDTPSKDTSPTKNECSS